VLFRIVLPLAVLAGAGSSLLPGFPEYTYDARPGDAYGYHAAARELLATTLRLRWALPGVVLAVVVVVVVVLRWRPRPRERPLLALVAVWCVGAIATLLVLRMRPSGAVTIGWPLLWSLPLLPFRALGLPLSPNVAFGFGLALSLAANAVSVVSTYLLGVWSTGRRGVGLVAAGLFGLLPLLLLIVGKTRDLGTWQADLGLSLYSEPISTALVTTACALVVRGLRNPLSATAAGALLGFSVTVRLSNAVIVACVVVLLALRNDRVPALRVAAAGLAFLPVVLAYWPMGYEMLPPEQFPDDPFGLRYVVPAWRDSVVWGARAFVVLIPLAVLGVVAIARWRAALLGSWVLSTALFYTFYSFTPLHPRFLFVALPALFVLWGAGLTLLLDRIRAAVRPTAAQHS
jgi:hypothetical protein